MKTIIWWVFLAVVVVYIGLIFLLGFHGFVARSIQFGRVSISIAVLILYLPGLRYVFREIPAPRRDYLLAGIILTWLSGVSFSIWNEAGRVFHVDTSINTSVVAGFFSFLLIVGGVFHLIAPSTSGKITRGISLVVGLVMGALIAFIAPLFRF